jgi:hypothetical protein
MIEWFMFGALGFFLGCLFALMLAPPLWNRAVKLTTRKLEATMPMSLADIQANKDQLRAEFAIELRKVEVALDKSKEKAARELIEANKRRVEIQVLNADLGGVKAQHQESQNANRVLQQTIKRRLPDLDSRLKAAKKALNDLDTVNAELRNTVASHSDALKIARGTVHNQRSDIDRLRSSLESGSGGSLRGSSKANGRAVAESQRLAAELSRAQEELDRAKTSAQENAFLRSELSQLAAQILAATRNQAIEAQPIPAEMAAEMAGGGAEDVSQAQTDDAEPTHVEPAHAEPTYAERVAQPEVDWRDAHHGHSAAPEPEVEEVAEDAVETEYVEETVATDETEYAEEPTEYVEEAVAEEAAETAYAEETAATEYAEEHETEYVEEAETEYAEEPVADEEDYAEQEDETDEAEEPEPPKRGLAARFAARRAKRNAAKAGSSRSLSDRLRGVTSESPETHT